MNTVVSLFKNNSDIDNLRDAGYGSADFEVMKTPLYYYNNSAVAQKVANKDMYFRADTGHQLAIHGSKYKMVSHQSMIETARNVLERSQLNVKDIKETIQVGDDGGVCFVRHQLPNHQIETPDGDTAIMELLHINSHTSVWPYQATAGANQNACTNHQVFLGEIAAIYKARHTQALDVDKGASQMNKIMDVMDQQNNIWATWKNTDVALLQAVQHIAEATGSKVALDLLKEKEHFSEILNTPAVYNNNSFMYAIDRYMNLYSTKMGKNYWAVYNALTDWATHHTGTRKNTIDLPTSQVKRSEKIQQAIRNFSIAA
tara:strand:+ start:4098 stop:5042 length:945 start_codon:yes stop_codon:yes gene_type:complete